MPMEIDERAKRSREATPDEEEDGEEETEQGNKKNSSGEKVHTRGIDEKHDEGIEVTTLKKAWSREEDPQKKEGEKKNAPPEQMDRQKMKELKTLVEMVLGEADRNRTTEIWRRVPEKIIICDAEKLDGRKKSLAGRKKDYA